MDATGRLFVYQKAKIALRLCEDVARLLPSERAYLAHQLRRAALSVVLNIAEGAGEVSVREKVRFYRLARRSANEAAAALEAIGIVMDRPPPTDAARAELMQVIALLVRTARSLEGNEQKLSP